MHGGMFSVACGSRGVLHIAATLLWPLFALSATGCERAECADGETLSCTCGILEGQQTCVDGLWGDCDCPDCDCDRYLDHQECNEQAECVCIEGYDAHLSWTGEWVCCDPDSDYTLFCDTNGYEGDCFSNSTGDADCSTLTICDGNPFICNAGYVGYCVDGERECRAE